MNGTYVELEEPLCLTCVIKDNHHEMEAYLQAKMFDCKIVKIFKKHDKAASIPKPLLMATVRDSSKKTSSSANPCDDTAETTACICDGDQADGAEKLTGSGRSGHKGSVPT